MKYQVYKATGQIPKYLLLVCVFLFPFSDSFSQQSRSNHEKYWYIRNKLKNKFVRIGDQEGESLPGGIRRTHPDAVNGDKHSLDFGDGTIYLGWYIGVLATEVYLLQNSGQDYTETSRELYYALLAFDRLDMNSEILWSNWNDVVPDEATPNNDGSISEAPWNAMAYDWQGTGQSLNGFFCRNDAPPYFENRFEPGEYDFIQGGVARLWNPSAPSWTNNGETWFHPPYTYRNVNYAKKGSEASHDQIFNLFMGFLLTQQFANVTYNGVNLSDKAKEQALRIVGHYNSVAEFRNPGRDQPCGNSNGCLPFNGGGASVAFAYPIAVYAHYLANGEQFIGGPPQDAYELVGGNPYWTNFTPVWFSKQAWYVWNWDPSLPNSHVNHHLRMMMAALSNTFKVAGGPQKLYNMGTTNDDIGWEFYYLLNKAIYPNNTEHWDGYSVRDELALCPCDGTHNLPGDSPEPWNISNRYVFGYKGDDIDSWFHGEYGGLDYMLLYNLFAIVYDDYNGSSYTDHINRKLNAGSVYPSGTFASTTNSETFVGFNTLETNMVVNGPIGGEVAGDVTLKAGKKITLLPGFKAQSGSEFLAYINSDFDCNANGFYKRSPLNDNIPMKDAGNRLLSEAYTYRADSMAAAIERQILQIQTTIDVKGLGVTLTEKETTDIILIPTLVESSFGLQFDATAVSVIKIKLNDYPQNWT